MKRIKLMKQIMFYAALSAVFLLGANMHSLAQSVSFNDSNSDTLFAGNSFYEVALSKQDGHINFIKDKSTNKIISIGDENSSLWRVVFQNGGDIYSVNFVGGQSNRFSYQWYSSGDSLVFHYTPDQNMTQKVTVSTTFTFSDGHYFDLEMHLKNNTGDSVLSVNIPRNLMFDLSDMKNAYLPVLPGVKLHQGFFTDHKDWNNGNYPSALNFADYIQLETTNGNFAFYHILKKDLTPLVVRRLYYEYNNDLQKDVYVLAHNFQPVLPSGQEWDSPILRFRVGQDVYTTAEDYRKDYGLDSAPSVHDKLGADYQKIVEALYNKIGIDDEYNYHDLPLSNRGRYKQLLSEIPKPSLLFILGWEERGFDENNPDIFPPDKRFGSNQDLKALSDNAKSLGHVMEPYINPTFWDDQSPTLQMLNPQDVAVLDHGGKPHYEQYGSGTHIHGGYGITPWNSSVISRLQQQMDNVKKYIAPKTLFVDQIGSRAGLDYNPSEPNTYAQAQGWLEYARKYKSMNIIDEFGYDRMVKPLLGFEGSILEFTSNGDQELGDGAWGKGNWELFPLIPYMVGDKILMYDATDNYIKSKDMITWSFAMDQFLSYVDSFADTQKKWLWIAASLQKNAMSLLADERVRSYTHQSDSVTVTTYDNYKVTTNWSKLNNLQTGNDIIAPDGFLMTDNNGEYKAGIFQKFNGHDLTSGDNYIVYHAYSDSLVVFYPQGPGTKLWVNIPTSWGTNPDVHVYAVAFDSTITKITPDLSNNKAGFTVSVKMNNQRIDKYVVTNGPLYLTSPILSYPGDGKDLNPDSLQFKWSKVDGAENYDMQIASDRAFNKILYTYSDITDTVTTLDSLDTGISFYWRVRANKTGQSGPWSNVSEFRVAGINLEDGIIAYYPFQGNADDAGPDVNNGVVKGGVQLTKDQAGNANSAYDFDGSSGYINITESASYLSIKNKITVAAWVYPRSYNNEVGVIVHDNFWRLMLSQGNVTGNIFNDQWQEKRVQSNEQAPLNTWSHITFTYDGNTIKVYLNGKLKNKLDFPVTKFGNASVTSPIQIGHGIGLSQNFFDGMMDNVIVYNRALADTEVALLAKKKILLLPPALLSPNDQSDEDSLKTRLIWHKQVGAQKYKVQLSHNRNFNYAMIMDTTVTDTMVSVPDIQIDSTYYWRVRSIGDSTTSNWSLYNSFHNNTVLAGIQSSNQKPAQYQLYQNYPNPFNPTTTISYRLKTAQQVHVTIYDILGRRVAVLVDQKESAGLHTITFDASRLSSGLYFYRLRTKNFTSIKKMILLK